MVWNNSWIKGQAVQWKSKFPKYTCFFIRGKCTSYGNVLEKEKIRGTVCSCRGRDQLSAYQIEQIWAYTSFEAHCLQSARVKLPDRQKLTNVKDKDQPHDRQERCTKSNLLTVRLLILGRLAETWRQDMIWYEQQVLFFDRLLRN